MTDATTDAATDATRQATRAMMDRDLASAALGMIVERDDPGYAVVSMRVRDDMTNGFHITHGGLVFTLADTAFAIACNEDHTVTVAAARNRGMAQLRLHHERCQNKSAGIGEERNPQPEPGQQSAHNRPADVADQERRGVGA